MNDAAFAQFNSLESRQSCRYLRLTVTLQHGENEGAHTGPRAAAVFLCGFPVVRAPRAGRRRGGGGAGWRGRGGPAVSGGS